MLFWIMPLCFVAIGLIYAVGWFFNTDYYHSMVRVFWLQLVSGLVGNIYLLPMLAYGFYYEPDDIPVLKIIYLCFCLGLVIITFGQALLYYRKTYIMVDKS